MPSAQEARKKIEDLLENRISLEEFEDWSASFSWNIHRHTDKEVQAIAYQIRSILNEHSDDATEAAVRQELADAARPFAPCDSEQPTIVVVQYDRAYRQEWTPAYSVGVKAAVILLSATLVAHPVLGKTGIVEEATIGGSRMNSNSASSAVRLAIAV